MTMLRWSAALIAVAALAGANRAEAQSVTVQGQVQYQPYQQQQGYGQPPPGYGQPYQQPYQQPYAQPQYAPTYQQPQPQVQYVERTESIKGLWIAGIIVFGASYVVGGLTSFLSWNATFSDWMWVPVIGPWVAAGYALNEDELAGSILGGIGQAAGLTMFILGLALQRTVRVAVYALDDSDERSPELALDLLPTVGGAQVGLTLSHF